MRGNISAPSYSMHCVFALCVINCGLYCRKYFSTNMCSDSGQVNIEKGQQLVLAIATSSKCKAVGSNVGQHHTVHHTISVLH